MPESPCGGPQTPLTILTGGCDNLLIIVIVWTCSFESVATTGSSPNTSIFRLQNGEQQSMCMRMESAKRVSKTRELTLQCITGNQPTPATQKGENCASFSMAAGKEGAHDV